MARACAVGIVTAIASATLGAEHVYADGPLNFNPFLRSSKPPPPPPPSPQTSSPMPPPPSTEIGKDDLTSRVRNDQPRTSTAGFDPDALERGVQCLKEIEKSPEPKKVFEILKKQEETRQKGLEARKAEFEAARAQSEIHKQQIAYEEQKKLTKQQAEANSQLARYNDELAKKRMQLEHESQRARNQELVKLQEESSIRLEQQRLMIEAEILAQKLKTEEKRAEIERENTRIKALAEAEANAREKKLSEEVDMRRKLAELAASKERVELAINMIFKHIGDGVKLILTDKNKLMVAVGGVTALAAGVYTTREGAKVIWGYVDRILGQPSLIRESSRGKYPWSRIFSSGMSTLSTSKGSSSTKGFGDVILNPSLQKRVEHLARATKNTKSHQAPFRNMLFYGPPGTGKTMAARELAQQSGLEYALMTGGDVAPLGPKAVTKIHELFDWSKRSRKGLLLFIDEADAFLNERNKTYMSEAQRSALNALLYRTGDQSKDIVLALATNRPGDLDSAVSDRIDEVLEFPLPGEEERFKLLKLYLNKYIENAGAKKSSWWPFSKQTQKKIELKGLSDEILQEVAVKTEGFSGREIAKLMASVQAAVYGSQDCVLDSNLFREVVDYKVAEHQQRRKFSASKGDGL
ncbi:hypothetical protein AQUCO_01600361v1 [Aquilegia coerulea]|uniref:AAA+ ATPase domain-containing protein n=1 Tax=Aquilegia coerulea TaxID=218851 RepID=A0A2G5DS15_AQUCA|nr:hypothetical protein AQUCO_01600361v1 [Aquilegia coerulea]